MDHQRTYRQRDIVHVRRRCVNRQTKIRSNLHRLEKVVSLFLDFGYSSKATIDAVNLRSANQYISVGGYSNQDITVTTVGKQQFHISIHVTITLLT